MVTVLVTVAIGARPDQDSGPTAATSSGPVVAELRTLRGDNGLYARPGLERLGEPSLFSSAYGLPAIRRSGGRAPEIDVATARRLFDEAKDSDGDPDEVAPYLWFARVVGPDVLAADQEHAERALQLAAEQHNGLDRDIVDASSALEIAELSRATVSPETRRRLTARLETGLRQSTNPFLVCQSATGLAQLGHPPADHIPPGSLGEVSAADIDDARGDVLRLYGLACLTTFGGDVSDAVRGSALDALGELASDGSLEDPFVAYYFAQAWEWMGGTTTALQDTARTLESQIDPATGLVRELVTRIGTLATTFDVLALAGQHGHASAMMDDTLDTALQQAMVEAEEQHDDGSVLTILAIYRLAGRTDFADRERRALEWAHEHLGQKVSTDQVLAADRVVRMLTAASLPVPETRIETPRIFDDGSRYQAWVAISLSDKIDPRLKEAPEVVALIRETPALVEGGGLSAMEVAAALGAARAAGAEVDREKVRSDLVEMRGCRGYESLYRPSLDEAQCDLGTTVRLTEVGVVASPSSR